MTKTDKVIKFLIEGLKCTEFPSTSRKYRLFKKQALDGQELRFWVGKAGAVRMGRTVSDSLNMTARIETNMRLWEKRTYQKA